MKRYLFIFLCLPTLLAQAQKPREILDRAADKIRSLGAVTVDFTATAYMDADDSDVMTGSMSIEGKKFRLESKGLKIWYDGQTEWTYAIASGEVYVTTPTATEMQMVNPLSFLDAYKQGYKISAKKLTQNGKQSFEVRLRATSKEAAADEVTLLINTSSYLPQSIRIKQNGQESRISVTSIQGAQKFAKDHFTFNPYLNPKAEVIDLR